MRLCVITINNFNQKIIRRTKQVSFVFQVKKKNAYCHKPLLYLFCILNACIEKKIKSLALLHTFHKAISSQIEVGEDCATPGNLTASLTWSYTVSIYSCQKRILEWTDPWFDQVEDLLCSYLSTVWQEGSLGEVIATTFLFLLHGPSLRTAGIPFKLLIFFFFLSIELDLLCVPFIVSVTEEQ